MVWVGELGRKTYVHIHICIHAHVCTYDTYMQYIHTYIHINIYMYMYIYICIHVHVHVYMHMYRSREGEHSSTKKPVLHVTSAAHGLQSPSPTTLLNLPAAHGAHVPYALPPATPP